VPPVLCNIFSIRTMRIAAAIAAVLPFSSPLLLLWCLCSCPCILTLHPSFPFRSGTVAATAGILIRVLMLHVLHRRANPGDPRCLLIRCAAARFARPGAVALSLGLPCRRRRRVALRRFLRLFGVARAPHGLPHGRSVGRASAGDADVWSHR
jgi:hypothetical protein